MLNQNMKNQNNQGNNYLYSRPNIEFNKMINSQISFLSGTHNNLRLDQNIINKSINKGNQFQFNPQIIPPFDKEDNLLEPPELCLSLNNSNIISDPFGRTRRSQIQFNTLSQFQSRNDQNVQNFTFDKSNDMIFDNQEIQPPLNLMKFQSNSRRQSYKPIILNQQEVQLNKQQSINNKNQQQIQPQQKLKTQISNKEEQNQKSLIDKELLKLEMERLQKKDSQGAKYWTKSKDQKMILENEYKKNPGFWDENFKKSLAIKLGLTFQQVQKWNWDKRQKDKAKQQQQSSNQDQKKKRGRKKKQQ